MTLGKIEKRLCDLLINDSEKVVISLFGEWGTGKTHFWKNRFLKNNEEKLKKRKIAYVSLFGASSIEEIKTSIAFQISPAKKKISQIKNKYGSGVDTVSQATTGIGGFSHIFSVLTGNDFKDVLVCFDDFERISSKVDLKDVLGFISELKEQKECSVLMILNEKELENLSDAEEKKYSEIFALYKEKIIDYEFPFKPTVEESFHLAIKDIKIEFDKRILESTFLKFDINNIRVIRKIVNKLNDFSFINEQKYNQKVLEDFLFTAVSIFDFILDNNLTKDSYLSLREKNNIYNMSNEEFNILTKTSEHRFFSSIDNEIEGIVINYISSQTVTKEYLKDILKDKNNHLERYSVEDDIRSLWHKFHIDFQYSRESLIENLIKIFLDNEKDLHNILKIKDFHSYVTFINEKEEKFKKETVDSIVKNYIDKLVKQDMSLNILERDYKSFIEKKYSHLLEYWEKGHNVVLINNIRIDKIEQIFDKLRSGWSDRDAFILNNINSDDYQNYIKSSPTFTKKIIYFLETRKNVLSDFGGAIKNIKQALFDLSKLNEDYKFKVDKIIKKTGIELDGK